MYSIYCLIHIHTYTYLLSAVSSSHQNWNYHNLSSAALPLFEQIDQWYMYTISSCFCNRARLFFWMLLCLAKHFNACESMYFCSQPRLLQVVQVAASFQHLLILVNGLNGLYLQYICYTWHMSLQLCSLQFWRVKSVAQKLKVQRNLQLSGPTGAIWQFHNPCGCCNW